jgi:hypothetical protein
MDNKQLERGNTLAEKAFNRNISPDELKEYLHLLDEWEVLDYQSIVDGQNLMIN